MTELISFLFGLALGLWAGRKHAKSPDYFGRVANRLMSKVQK